jgi:hypothetical protein
MTEGWLSHYGRALKAMEAVERVRAMCLTELSGRHVEGALQDGDGGPALARDVLAALDGAA